jgi:predicted transcriptional regulator of viral defense system
MKILPVVFSYEDVSADFPNRDAYSYFLVSYLRTGRIRQVRKDMYALVDPSNGSVMASKFQIASHIGRFSFLCFHSALEYYGLAEQSFVSFLRVGSLRRFRNFDFEDVTYSCEKKKDLEGVNDFMAREGVRVTCLERTVIDCLYNLDKGGGYEEVTKAVSLIEDLSGSKLLDALSDYNVSFLFLKAGFILEKYYRGKLSDSFYDECLAHISKKKYYFGARKGNGIYVSKWNLIVPKEKEELNEIF